MNRVFGDLKQILRNFKDVFFFFAHQLCRSLFSHPLPSAGFDFPELPFNLFTERCRIHMEHVANIHSVLPRAQGNRAYSLHMPSGKVDVYCHMSTQGIGACGGGGWTLVMKTDGNKVHVT